MKTFSSSLPLASPYFHCHPQSKLPSYHPHYILVSLPLLLLALSAFSQYNNQSEHIEVKMRSRYCCALNSSSFPTYCRKKSRLLGGAVKSTWSGHLLLSVVSTHQTICVHSAPATLAPLGFLSIYVFIIYLFGCIQSSSQHVGSLVAAHRLSRRGTGSRAHGLQ